MSQQAKKRGGNNGPKIDPALLAWGITGVGGKTQASGSSLGSDACTEGASLTGGKKGSKTAEVETSTLDLDAILASISKGADQTKTRDILAQSAITTPGDAAKATEQEIRPIGEADFRQELNRLSVSLTDKVRSVRLAAVSGITKLLEAYTRVVVDLDLAKDEGTSSTVSLTTDVGGKSVGGDSDATLLKQSGLANTDRKLWAWAPLDDGQTRASEYTIKMGVPLVAVEGAEIDDEVERTIAQREEVQRAREQAIREKRALNVNGEFECEEDRLLHRLASGEKLELTSYDEDRLLKRAQALALEAARLKEEEEKLQNAYASVAADLVHKLTGRRHVLTLKDQSKPDSAPKANQPRISVSVQPILSTDSLITLQGLVKPLLKRLVDPVEAVRMSALRALAIILAVLPANVPRLATSWQVLWKRTQILHSHMQIGLKPEDAGDADQFDDDDLEDALDDSNVLSASSKYEDSDDSEEDEDDGVIYLSRAAKKKLAKQIEGDFVMEWAAASQGSKAKDALHSSIAAYRRSKVYLSLPGESKTYGIATLLPFIIPVLAMRLVDPSAELEVTDAVKEQMYANPDFHGESGHSSSLASSDPEEQLKLARALAAIRENSRMRGITQSTGESAQEPSDVVKCELIALLAMVLQRCTARELEPFLSDLIYIANSCLLDRSSVNIPALTAQRIVIPLCRIFPKVIRPAAPSLLFAVMKALNVSNGRGRLALLGAMEILVHCGASDLIRDLAGFREHNVIVIKELIHSTPRLNYFAILSEDRDPRVRARLVTALGNWMTTLQDRHDYETLLMPYLFGATSDPVPAIAQAAVRRLITLGRTHEKDEYAHLQEETFYERELSQFQRRALISVPLLLPEPFTERPGPGLRALGRKFLPRLLGALIDELTDWKQSTKGRSAALLKTMLVLTEEYINSHIPKLVQGYLGVQDAINEGVAVALRNWICQGVSTITDEARQSLNATVVQVGRLLAMARDTTVYKELSDGIVVLVTKNGLTPYSDKVLMYGFGIYPTAMRILATNFIVDKCTLSLRNFDHESNVSLLEMADSYATQSCELPEESLPVQLVPLQSSDEKSKTERRVSARALQVECLMKLVPASPAIEPARVRDSNLVGMQLLGRYANASALFAHLLRHAMGEGIVVGTAGLDANYRAKAWQVMATMISALPLGTVLIPVSAALTPLRRVDDSDGIFSRHAGLSKGAIRCVCAAASVDWKTVRKLVQMNLKERYQHSGTSSVDGNGWGEGGFDIRLEDLTEALESKSSYYEDSDSKTEPAAHTVLIRRFEQTPKLLIYQLWNSLMDSSAWVLANATSTDLVNYHSLQSHFNTFNQTDDQATSDGHEALGSYVYEILTWSARYEQLLAVEHRHSPAVMQHSARQQATFSAAETVELHHMLQKSFANLFTSYVALMTDQSQAFATWQFLESGTFVNAPQTVLNAIAEGFWPEFVLRRTSSLLAKDTISENSIMLLRHMFYVSLYLARTCEGTHRAQHMQQALDLLAYIRESTMQPEMMSHVTLAEVRRFLGEVLLMAQEYIARGAFDERKRVIPKSERVDALDLPGRLESTPDPSVTRSQEPLVQIVSRLMNPADCQPEDVEETFRALSVAELEVVWRTQHL